MSIVRSSLPLSVVFHIAHQSVPVRTTMIKLHFSLYVLCIGQRECCIFSPFSLLSLSLSLSFLLVRLRAFACISVGGGREREKKYSSNAVRHTTYAHFTIRSQNSETRSSLLFSFFLSLSSVVLCGWMWCCKDPEVDVETTWNTRKAPRYERYASK